MGELGLHAASLAGLEERVRYLVEEGIADVNEVDRFDSTPLYYAVYGGHPSVVRILLENGARCDPDTFVGERCYYGALNDSIRSLLTEHNATDFSVRAKHPFAKFLGALAKAERFHDIRFAFGGEEPLFSAPRVILGARCEVLRSRLETTWARKDVVSLSTRKASAVASRAILRYVCTGRLVVATEHAADALRVARTLRLDSLARSLERTSGGRGTVVYEDDFSFLRESMEPLAACVSTPLGDPRPESPVSALAAALSDATIACSDGELRVPSVFLRFRSDVVDAAFATSFSEALDHRLVLSDLSCRAASAIVRWCCCGTCATNLRRDAALAADVLAAAHRFLMPSELLSAAAGAMAEALLSLSGNDATAALSALPYADLVGDRADRLYDAVCKVCAADLRTAVTLDAFERAVADSANSIHHRQATDSIPFVDDVRVALRALYNPFEDDPLDGSPGAIEEAARLTLLDRLLDRLGFEA
ncbi:hypothetical protein CTAYLR_006643 [Chrysophaeum taylorii]|uniref:BTB domain-containing protein n=1 Tax=Chrysophaeum taylorii TaxID=2483200 RepID=A0AAD7UK50_9STRA|nr:hypothetical protein CTAYLR_006643 [Chrysophaeum taylorii]